MASHAHEFHCSGGCKWYNYPMLNESMTGNYTIVCGNPDCKHQHYRVIRKGVITDDRHSSSLKNNDTIHIVPSACTKERRKMGVVTQLRNLAAAGLAK